MDTHKFGGAKLQLIIKITSFLEAFSISIRQQNTFVVWMGEK